MGLLYTVFHMDFEENEWKQISNNPIVFQTIKDDVTLEIEDLSHKSYKLNFKKGGKFMVALTSSISKVTFIRKYQYSFGKWKVI